MGSTLHLRPSVALLKRDSITQFEERTNKKLNRAPYSETQQQHVLCSLGSCLDVFF